MNRYFFDVAAKTYVQYDYKGRDFERPDQARELAELIALDVECIDGDGSVGMEVQVRNIGGETLFAVPIRDPALIAA
ncbi:MAG: hypothetical protein ABWY66_09610 [Xanthobacteraceae bacterium]|jgi:Domain of unknown function (DUF6894)